MFERVYVNVVLLDREKEETIMLCIDKNWKLFTIN